MLTLELAQHPELTALVMAIRRGEAVDVVDHGRPVMRCVPPPVELRDRLVALHRRFTSPVYAGSEVVDMRREAPR
jgi:antitoxin (DNA-binding transcriptional repressor) of toxin-antitoxin stability system